MFYNGAMTLDRDLGVALARALAAAEGGGRSGWEMLAATGVRALRVLRESELLDRLVLTERNPEAAAVLVRNAARYADRGARALPADAKAPPPGGPFAVVDLDPYGSPIPFVDALFAAAADPALITVTATDLRVLAGVDRGVCERRYGAVPVRGRLSPEGALRVLLGWLARQATSRGRSIEPILSYVQDHYVRVYVRSRRAADGPTPPVAPLDPAGFGGPRLPTNRPIGPLWIGPLFDPAIVDRIEVPESAARPVPLARLVARFREEARINAPFFHEANELARDLGLASPPPVEPLLERLRAGGWRSARTHVRPGAFRTEAPRVEVERLARAVAPA